MELKALKKKKKVRVGNFFQEVLGLYFEKTNLVPVSFFRFISCTLPFHFILGAYCNLLKLFNVSGPHTNVGSSTCSLLFHLCLPIRFRPRHPVPREASAEAANGLDVFSVPCIRVLPPPARCREHGVVTVSSSCVSPFKLGSVSTDSSHLSYLWLYLSFQLIVEHMLRAQNYLLRN